MFTELFPSSLTFGPCSWLLFAILIAVSVVNLFAQVSAMRTQCRLCPSPSPALVSATEQGI